MLWKSRHGNMLLDHSTGAKEDTVNRAQVLTYLALPDSRPVITEWNRLLRRRGLQSSYSTPPP